MKKKYAIKLGQFYIQEITLNEDCPKTSFIEEISLTNEFNSMNCYLVSESEQEKIRKMLKENLDLTSEYTEISFEEVED